MKPLNEADKIATTLTQMADILVKSQHAKFWDKKLRSLAAKTTLQIDDLRAQIKQMYGGMGSINDLYVQFPNGDPDHENTDRFSQLAAELYRLASRPNQNPDADQAIIPLKDASRRLIIIERADGIFSIAEEYYYISTDRGDIISEGWIRLPADGLFGTFEQARREAVAMSR